MVENKLSTLWTILFSVYNFLGELYSKIFSRDTSSISFGYLIPRARISSRNLAGLFLYFFGHSHVKDTGWRTPYQHTYFLSDIVYSSYRPSFATSFFLASSTKDKIRVSDNGFDPPKVSKKHFFDASNIRFWLLVSFCVSQAIVTSSGSAIRCLTMWEVFTHSREKEKSISSSFVLINTISSYDTSE